MPKTSSNSKRYAPRSDSQLDRVGFGLKPEQVAEADQLAKAAGITRAALLREVHLLGIPLYRAQHPVSTPNET